MRSFGSLVILNVEVSEFVVVLAGGNNSQVLLKVLLLQVLLGQVLEVSLGEGDGGLNDDGGRVLGDGDMGTEISGLTINLNVLLEVVFEVVKHNDVVFDWQLAVDDELQANLLLLLRSLLDHLLSHLGVYLIYNNNKESYSIVFSIFYFCD